MLARFQLGNNRVAKEPDVARELITSAGQCTLSILRDDLTESTENE